MRRMFVELKVRSVQDPFDPRVSSPAGKRRDLRRRRGEVCSKGLVLRGLLPPGTTDPVLLINRSCVALNLHRFAASLLWWPSEHASSATSPSGPCCDGSSKRCNDTRVAPPSNYADTSVRIRG